MAIRFDSLAVRLPSTVEGPCLAVVREVLAERYGCPVSAEASLKRRPWELEQRIRMRLTAQVADPDRAHGCPMAREQWWIGRMGHEDDHGWPLWAIARAVYRGAYDYLASTMAAADAAEIVERYDEEGE